MSAIEYSLKLTQLSKYDPNMVENSRELFSKYVVRVFEFVGNENCSTMLIPSINI